MANYTETIPPRDGKLEDKIVFGGILLIMLAAAFLLFALYPPQADDFVAIPKPIRASLTALSNAGEELSMIQEIEGAPPTLASIREMRISPFVESGLKTTVRFEWTQDGNCLLGQSLIWDERIFLIRLDLAAPGTNYSPQIYWQELAKASPTETPVKYCHSPASEWQLVSAINQAVRDRHDH